MAAKASCARQGRTCGSGISGQDGRVQKMKQLPIEFQPEQDMSNPGEGEKMDRPDQKVQNRDQGTATSPVLAEHPSRGPQRSTVPEKKPWPRLAAVGGLLGAAFLWSYWPTLCGLAETWNHVQDYSHGYLVVPLAVLFLWARRDRMPTPAGSLAWPGLLLVAISVAMRFAGAWYYFESLDGWSILLWVAGVIWLFLGRAFLWWSLPSVAFLAFMVRLPFKAELALSLPLQTVATNLSCWVLQMLGQPALAEGHTIYLGEHTLEVEQACSGLRIFIGIGALAFAYVVIVRRTWWEKAVLLLSVVPIALIANATRVVVTGLLCQYFSGEAARRFSHDVAGWGMILFAAGLFALVLWYLGMLVREVEPVEMGDLVRRGIT
ncbi:MAG: exosortase/archaeosortase family protein [Thermoguttaceae bacterium]